MFALVGSANVDIRSFALNEEISLLFYDGEWWRRLIGIQDNYLANSALLVAHGAPPHPRPVMASALAGSQLKHCLH